VVIESWMPSHRTDKAELEKGLEKGTEKVGTGKGGLEKVSGIESLLRINSMNDWPAKAASLTR
jgi:hypothetical protein